MRRADFDRAVGTQQRRTELGQEMAAAIIVQSRRTISDELLVGSVMPPAVLLATVEKDLVDKIRAEVLGLEGRIALRRDFEPLFRACAERGDLLDLAVAFRDRLASYAAEAMP